MLGQLKSVVVDADPANCREMATFLTNRGVAVIAQLPGVDQLPAVLGGNNAPQLVVVNLDPSPHEMLKRMDHLVRQFPSISFFVMSQAVDANVLMEAIHMGVREFIPLPIDEEKFSAGIERVASAHGMGKRARIIHMIPTAGGCGSTTIACNVAASLAQHGRTVLIDLDLMRGGAASSFDLHPRYTIADVMDSEEELDGQVLNNALAVHKSSGLAILARPDLPEDTLRVNPSGLIRLLNVLGRMFDYVVMDSLMSIDPLYSAAVLAADLNVLVMQLNIPSARNAERFVGAMRRLGVDAGKIRLVVNRFVKKGWDIAPDEVEKALGLKISWLVPNDFKNAIAAINLGEPVVLRSPRAEMSTSLCELATMLNSGHN